MGKSSPTKLQLKHLPDAVIMETVFMLQHCWTVWFGTTEDPGAARTLFQVATNVVPSNSLHYRRKKMAHLSEIVEALQPIPEKLVWKKLQKLEAKGLIEGYGPSGCHYAVVME